MCVAVEILKTTGSMSQACSLNYGAVSSLGISLFSLIIPNINSMTSAHLILYNITLITKKSVQPY